MKKIQSFGPKESFDLPQQSGIIHPSHKEYPVPEGALKETYTWFIAQQVKSYGKSFEQSPTILKRNLKLLNKEYSWSAIKRAIVFACMTSEFPFSTKYLKEILKTWT